MVGFEPISVSALMGYPFQLESTFVIFTFQTFSLHSSSAAALHLSKTFPLRGERKGEKERGQEKAGERERERKNFFLKWK